MFGPPSDTAGMRAGTYYQVTIDPGMASPGGHYIRFDAGRGDEIHGWQRIEALTICEILEEFPSDSMGMINMRMIVKPDEERS